MIFIKTKLFWKIDATSRHIHCVSYDDNVEYYTFLRKCRNEGYKQVIITTEIMVQIIRYACLEKSQIVYKIEFVEEDSELESEINAILQTMAKKPAYLTILLDKLNFLSESSSIDIKRIYVKGMYENKDTVVDNYFIQSNGIIGVNEESFSKVSTELSALVEGCLS